MTIAHTNQDEALQQARETSQKIKGKVGLSIDGNLPCYKVLKPNGKKVESHTYPPSKQYYYVNCQPT